MARSGLCVDCWRVMGEIQHKNSLKHLLQNFILSPFIIKMVNFTTHHHFVSWLKIIERGKSSFILWLCAFFSYKEPFYLVLFFFFDKYPLSFLKRNVDTIHKTVNNKILLYNICTSILFTHNQIVILTTLEQR